MGCLGLFRQVKFSVRLQHSVRFLHNSEGNLIYGKSIQGECSENALVYFHCRAAVFCVLHNSKEMKILYDWRGMTVDFRLEPTGVSGDTLFKIGMLYDGTGRRISKTRWVKAQSVGRLCF